MTTHTFGFDRVADAFASLEPSLGLVGKSTVEAAPRLGAVIAERAKAAGVTSAYFDRGGFLFHGRVKALAEAARENGLQV